MAILFQVYTYQLVGVARAFSICLLYDSLAQSPYVGSLHFWLYFYDLFCPCFDAF